MPTAFLLWFTSYVVIIVRKFGWLDSISRSWYSWLEEKNSRWFTVFCYGLGLGLILFVGTEYEHLKIGTSLMFLLGAFSIGAVGIASNYKDLKPTRVDLIHYAFSGLTIGCCLIALWIEVSWLYAGVFSVGTAIILILTALGKFKNAIFWIEVLGFYVIDVGLYQITER